jgi:hypothetical protein
MKLSPLLAPLAGRPLFLPLAQIPGLRDGWWRVTVFDWSALSEDDRAIAIENNLLVFNEKLPAGWDQRYVPFAWLGGENHPVEELDEQIDATLVIDLESPDQPVFLASQDSMSGNLTPFSKSFSSLDFRDERPT